MKVTVFGATGPTGCEVVEDLVFRGHEVIAYVPGAQEVPRAWHERVEVVVGDVADAAAVDAVVAGGQAVINALDPRLGHESRGVPMVEGTGNIVESMLRHGVRRYIGHGSPAVRLCPRERPTAGVRVNRLLVQCFRPRAYRQMVGMHEVVTGSGLDWTIVRFLHRRNGDARGLKRMGFLGDDAVGLSAVEVDIARFTAAQVLDTAYIGTAPAVSN